MMAATRSKPKTAAKKAKPTPPKAKKGGAPKKSAAKKAAAAKSKKAAAGSKPKAQAAKTSKASKAARTQKASKASKASKAKAPEGVLDFAGFPPGSVTRHEVTLCLSCIYKLFTNQLGLAPRTAYNEIRRYAPTVEELTARAPARPFFKPPGEKNPHCPYCEAPKRWHATLSVYRVEGGRASDAARRALVRKLPAKDEQFIISEEKRAARQVFFEWLERLGQALDFEDDAAWMLAAARAYIERRDPRGDWAAAFDGARAVRRSQRLEE
ncbi:MAG TPA: hypothetical protein VF570_03815, partial [Pyrinomonadaceae bacterium]